MTRKNAKELLPIIQAFAEGKAIQYYDSLIDIADWEDCENPDFENSTYQFRIKPEYRPFKTQEECWKEMMKHQPFGWLKSIRKQEKVHIGRVFEVKDYVLITLSINGILYNINNDSSYFFNEYTFADGTPFGIREEQQ